VKSESLIILFGLIMIVIGLLLFYSIQNNPDLDQILLYAKHGGTFVGLMGIGVAMAGILLRLMDKQNPAITEY